MEKIKAYFNFQNIGKKIKNLVQWVCWIDIILLWISCAIAFIALLVEVDYIGPMFLITIPIAIIGPFAIWISAWPMYAFGELVDSSMKTAGQAMTSGATAAKKPIFDKDELPDL